MILLAYNPGLGGLKRSRMLERRRAPGRGGCVLAANRVGGVSSAHLTERREKGRALFLTPA